MLYSRRGFIGASAALTVVGATAAHAEDACLAITPERQKATTPEAALRELMEGNERFVSGKMINCDLRKQVKATSTGQYPLAVIVGCIDSRVPPELVFDQQIGDIFSARIAGNFVNTDILGSLEFACKLAGSKAIVVLGHTECGAIKGAVDQARLGNLTAMLKNFDPAIAATKIEGERSSKNKKLVQAVAEANAQLTSKMILDQSPVLKEMADKKEIVVVAAMHDIKTGKVSFFN
ncbi:MAG: twin-arginine translocation signal domain-containing protein [Hyphomicrobiaceae bacterium]|nr:twin-arginine translocation signal domain-containing protein [Hyphomicrobiaceae bacterium]